MQKRLFLFDSFFPENPPQMIRGLLWTALSFR